MSEQSSGVPNAQDAYWERYYSAEGGARLPVPSQFAVFVQGELSGPVFVADLGCGTGRDSLFFASHGNLVVGVDAAAAAIARCTAAADELRLPVTFVHSQLGNPRLVDRLHELRRDCAKTMVYARFFLHAIDDAGEQLFLRLAAGLCKPGDLLAVEFRTVRDRSLAKVTPDHYRRFVEPAAFLTRCSERGFASTYFVEGFGFAKHKADDAYVARCLMVAR